jgi:hypothetical protein
MKRNTKISDLEMVDYLTGRMSDSEARLVESNIASSAELDGLRGEWEAALKTIAGEGTEAKRIAACSKDVIREALTSADGQSLSRTARYRLLRRASVGIAIAAAIMLVAGALILGKPDGQRSHENTMQVASRLEAPVTERPEMSTSLDTQRLHVQLDSSGAESALSPQVYGSLSDAVAAANQGDTVVLAGKSAETVRINKRLRIVAPDGPVRLGAAN